MARIWVDATGIRQANMLSFLAKTVSGRAEILVTTSADPRPARVFRFSRIPTARITGRGRDPLQRYANRIIRLAQRIEQHKPDLLISDLDSAAVRTAFGLGIPSWTIYSSTSESIDADARRMSYPLCDKVFASRFLPKEKLSEEGVPPNKLVQFNGFNECYMKSVDQKKARGPRVLLRPNGHDPTHWVRDVTTKILRDIEGSRLTVLGKARVGRPDREIGSTKVRFLEFTPYPPVMNQDLFIGWGRMLAESFVVGIPSIRTANDNYPDLSIVYSQQPEITDPEEISEASRSMLRDSQVPRPVTGMESPVAAVAEALVEQGLISQ